MPTISPLLAGNVILFVAQGFDYNPVYLPDKPITMQTKPYVVEGFTCHIKSKYATSVKGTPIAYKGVSFAPILANKHSLPGLKSDCIEEPCNLFRLAVDKTLYGLFAGCANPLALTNDMAGLSSSV